MLICEESAQEYDDIRNMEYYTAMKNSFQLCNYLRKWLW